MTGSQTRQTDLPSHGLTTRIGVYFLRHAQALGRSLSEVIRAPFTSLFSILAIAITLCLPAILYLLIENTAQFAGGWDKDAEISLFLHQDLPEEQAIDLAERLRKMPGVKSLDYISPAMALEQFKRYSEFSNVLDAIGTNPLPPTLVITPSGTSPAAAKSLLDQFSALPEVERSQLDIHWLQRLQGMIRIGEQALLFFSVVFGTAVMLIVGNMIRLLMQQRREEIEIIKLLGGSNAFIRRPFLYRGLLHGLLGGFVAWGLVSILVIQLQPEVTSMAKLFQSQLSLQHMDSPAIAAMIGLTAALGWLGAYLTVGRYLSAADPR